MNMSRDKISQLAEDVDSFIRSIKSGYKAAQHRMERAKRDGDNEEFLDALGDSLVYEIILSAANRFNLKNNVIERFNDCIEMEEEK